MILGLPPTSKDSDTVLEFVRIRALLRYGGILCQMDVVHSSDTTAEIIQEPFIWVFLNVYVAHALGDLVFH